MWAPVTGQAGDQGCLRAPRASPASAAGAERGEAPPLARSWGALRADWAAGVFLWPGHRVADTPPAGKRGTGAEGTVGRLVQEVSAGDLQEALPSRVPSSSARGSPVSHTQRKVERDSPPPAAGAWPFCA